MFFFRIFNKEALKRFLKRTIKAETEGHQWWWCSLTLNRGFGLCQNLLDAFYREQKLRPDKIHILLQQHYSLIKHLNYINKTKLTKIFCIAERSLGTVTLKHLLNSIIDKAEGWRRTERRMDAGQVCVFSAVCRMESFIPFGARANDHRLWRLSARGALAFPVFMFPWFWRESRGRLLRQWRSREEEEQE